tara:strand:- start:21 stop:1424 length:1404 start_codon:yes stop_codon:yes gene_type:complete
MFTLAIIGRPNVGKSTFFNRLVRKKLAIVEDRPGVTRDWRDAVATIDNREWIVLDTAGMEEATKGSMAERMTQRSRMAIEMADVILMMVDGRDGVTATDQTFAAEIRKSGKPIILAANKVEGIMSESIAYDAYSLGMGEPIMLSAEHGNGFGDFVDRLDEIRTDLIEKRAEAGLDISEFEDDEDEEEEYILDDEGEELPKSLKLAIVGRPNVGKSTLMNALLGQDRVLTGPEAGVTRDSIAVKWRYKDQDIRLVDTAGIRRKAKIDDVLEKTMVYESFRAIRLAHVVVLVLDSTEGIDKQDLTLARRAIEEGRVLVIAFNKWDAAVDKQKLMQETEWRLEDSLAQLKDIPLIPISALRGKRLDELMDRLLVLYQTWNKRVPTGEMNRWMETMTQSHPPPLVSGRPNKLKYITQIKSRPPTFALWASRPDALPDSYKRYIVNGLRKRFDIPGVPIRLLMRKSDNPYAK